jgi:hypothetical protein
MNIRSAPPTLYDAIRLGGGLDQITPTLSLAPGFIRRGANFECSITGGYTRIGGYERFDGRPSPSASIYLVLTCTLTGVVAVGDTVEGGASGDTAKVIAVSGSSVVVTKNTGFFEDGEDLEISSVVVGVINSITGMVQNALTNAQYKALAANEYRADILEVPGEGPVLGVSFYNGVVYTWRNNVGSTAAKMFKSSAAGWVEVALGVELKFDAGEIAILDGQTVNGQTSGATGVVTRVVVESGSWDAGDAAGKLIFASVSGAFQNNEHIRLGGGPKHALADGTQSAITLAPNGRVETVIANFGGGPANYRMYGSDAQNRGFEFDGTVYVPIKTGMTVDKPKHVAVHKNHLFYSFGASLQFSSLGEPYRWEPLVGAGEIAMNAEITNLIPLPGDQTSGALGVYTRRDTSVLYGTDSDSFVLATYNTGTGAVAYSAQNMDQVYTLDDRGVTKLGTTLSFGNFTSASLTMTLRPYMQNRINQTVASTVNRDKGQYRVFFADGTGIYMTVLNGQLLGTVPIQFAHEPTCAFEYEDMDGQQRIFLGASNGFVYELDKGTSFDGERIPASLMLVYASQRQPRILKQYRHAMLELTDGGYAEISFGYDLGYRTLNLTQADDQDFEKDLRSSYWDEFTWDDFIWDGEDLSPTEVDMTGAAENVAIRIASASDLFEPFTINSIILHYTPRRGMR